MWSLSPWLTIKVSMRSDPAMTKIGFDDGGTDIESASEPGSGVENQMFVGLDDGA